MVFKLTVVEAPENYTPRLHTVPWFVTYEVGAVPGKYNWFPLGAGVQNTSGDVDVGPQYAEPC
jgi:hypothetical protein